MVDSPVAVPQQLRQGPSLFQAAWLQMGWMQVFHEAWVGMSLQAL
jgi:hypothetical protein